jgi:hypothetical protein
MAIQKHIIVTAHNSCSTCNLSAARRSEHSSTQRLNHGEWRASRDTIRGEYVGSTWGLIRAIRDGETRVRPIVAVCGDAGKKNHVSRGSKCHVISRNPLQHELYVNFTDHDWLAQAEGAARAPNGELAGARFLASGETKMVGSWREPHDVYLHDLEVNPHSNSIYISVIVHMLVISRLA